jgi:hypothetical protein
VPFPYAAGEKPPAGKLGEGPNTYTPALTATTTNPNLGADGTAAGLWARIGPNVIQGEARFLFSGAGVSAGSGAFEISLPAPADLSLHATSTTPSGASIVGSGYITDADTAANASSTMPYLIAASRVRISRQGSLSGVAATLPFTWATGDRISIQFSYFIVAGS